MSLDSTPIDTTPWVFDPRPERGENTGTALLAASRKIQLREVLEIIAQLEAEGARDSREAVAQMEKEIEKVLSRFMKEKGLTELIEFYRWIKGSPKVAERHLRKLIESFLANNHPEIFSRFIYLFTDDWRDNMATVDDARSEEALRFRLPNGRMIWIKEAVEVLLTNVK